MNRLNKRSTTARLIGLDWENRRRINLAVVDRLFSLFIDDLHVTRIATRSRAGENQEQMQSTPAWEGIRNDMRTSPTKMKHALLEPASPNTVANDQRPHAGRRGGSHRIFHRVTFRLRHLHISKS